MIELGANLNHVDQLSNQTALFYAAREGHTELCKILIENGCNPATQDVLRKTASYYAKQQNNKETLSLINSYLNKKEEKIVRDNDNSRQHDPKKKKRDKENQKLVYKLTYHDEDGNIKELNQEDFDKFQKDHPDIAKLINNPDELIDSKMLN